MIFFKFKYIYQNLIGKRFAIELNFHTHQFNTYLVPPRSTTQCFTNTGNSFTLQHFSIILITY